jgi:hypothetical protein
MDGAPATTADRSRPVPVTIICVIGFLGVLVVIPLIFSAAARSIGAWFPAALAFNTVASFVSMVGLWQMRKWSVYLYAGATLLGEVFAVLGGTWTILSLVVPGIVIAVMVMYLNRMR